MARLFDKPATLRRAKPAPPRASSAPATSLPPGAPADSQTWPISAGLFALVLAVFWPCIGNGFLNYDDGLYVTQNAHVQQGLSAPGIAWAFQSGKTGNWHPVTWMSHMLDCQLDGRSRRATTSPASLLHAINSVLVFLLFALPDRRPVAQSLAVGSAVCAASAPGGVRRLGRRAQGCAEHNAMAADDVGVHVYLRRAPGPSGVAGAGSIGWPWRSMPGPR